MYAYASNFNKIEFVMDKWENFDINYFKIFNGTKSLSIEHYNILDKNIEIILSEEINIKNNSYIIYKNYTFPINYFPMYQSHDFNNRFYYKEDLGNFYTKNYCTFKVWSPAADSINLLIYKNGDTEIPEEPTRFKMNEMNGVFATTINEDLDGFFYMYEIKVFDEINIAVDPYAKAVGINGLRGAIINMKNTNPIGWENDRITSINSYTDAIIYETSVRDMTVHYESGVKNKGKFRGLSEINSKSSKNISTGLSHIDELGVTHVQLMPFFDFSYISVDEKVPVKYNWGYDPQNYNAPEGSYSTNPYSPGCRINELKEMIFQFHKKGIHINMDVVYNHVFNALDTSFEKIFPGYYLRRNLDGSLSNGSGCGNDTASENKMMQKFILDSVLFWRDEYHLDGFRFDLMGLHDIETMNLLKEKLDSSNKKIMIYGEGWDLATAIPSSLKTSKANCFLTPKIGFFNDYIRDVVKGNVFNVNEKGFVNGRERMEFSLRDVILGSKGTFSSPEQSINYVSCHDNFTLWDKFSGSNSNESIENKIKMVKLASAIILTSQGVPFLHSGEEFLRTKLGEHNSYNSPDEINNLDWDRKSNYLDVVDYHKGLILLRRLHPAFRMDNYADIEKNIEFLQGTPDNVVAYLIRNNANKDTWKNIIVIINGNKDSRWITLPQNQWYLTVDENIAGVAPIKLIGSPKINVSGISMYVAFSI